MALDGPQSLCRTIGDRGGSCLAGRSDHHLAHRLPLDMYGPFMDWTAQSDTDAFTKYTDEQLADIIARSEHRLERFATGDRWEDHRVNAAARKRRAEAELQRRASA